jgi:hypothetical protein
LWHHYQCPPGLTPGLVVPPPRPLTTGPGPCNPRHGIYDCWGLQCFGCLVAASAPCRAMETPPLGPTLLYRCNNVLFFLTLRGNFGADSNNFGPCPSHAFRLSEIQSLTDLLLYPVVVWANRSGFDSYNGSNSPAVRPHSMAPNPAPETTSCFAASGALLVPAPLQSQWRESESGPGPASARPESESLNQAESSLPVCPGQT